ncbi:SURF1 family protein [Agarivorans sp. 1_MG-2023]|uniref:SURF1 family protein n=1 Tax=Agarivorans sp. 1_MG-2023 TaxID=3062634 RepID=UPI0026E310F9|nr:SURF1 family cytochrome oxidase biogenesis protein [Agarivorans sp. 1_MG-2023]MDO6765703.1 SURF1 family cytochrome oxidase biogenesis protein [Agarivorans sp. 1_MG-2023]
MNISKLSQQTDKKTVSYRLILFVLLMVALIALMVKLSLWQWQRSEQKQQLLDQYQQQSLVETSLDKVQMNGAVPFQIVKVATIRAVGTNLWLDNQVEQGKVGYDAYTLATTPQGNVLVRLAWQPASYHRAELPQTLNTDALPNRYRLREVSLPVVLDKQLWLEAFPQGLRVQQVNIDALAEYWGIDLLPFVLDSQLEHSPEQLVSISPEKHKGYALQWLLMALVASGLTGYFCWQNRNKEGL